ncbi:unnamed protein product [Phytophthora lilii]|uniref:Unnamed protein product n=1 Tax=Phytophthora lilii TaxID=2077276 RepID=A0A9W6U3V4_9STRA|nr:unnamed protein product [Phytophthora lilii]
MTVSYAKLYQPRLIPKMLLTPVVLAPTTLTTMRTELLTPAVVATTTKTSSRDVLIESSSTGRQSYASPSKTPCVLPPITMLADNLAISTSSTTSAIVPPLTTGHHSSSSVSKISTPALRETASTASTPTTKHHDVPVQKFLLTPALAAALGSIHTATECPNVQTSSRQLKSSVPKLLTPGFIMATKPPSHSAENAAPPPRCRRLPVFRHITSRFE